MEESQKKLKSRAIPEVEPWHRKMWSEKEVIAMNCWKGSEDGLRYWQTIIRPKAHTYGGRFNADEIARLMEKNPDYEIR